MKIDGMSRWVATFMGLGFFPLAPGSLASVAGMLIALGLRSSPVFYFIVFAFIAAVGFFVSDRVEKSTGLKDPSFIVIDEVSGAMLAIFLLPVTPAVLWTSFFLFRAFDMFKIYPVNKFEPLKGGVGVMMDDIIAGIYTNLTMQVAIRLAGII